MALSQRDSAKLERAAQSRAAAEEREVERRLKAALRTPVDERTAADLALLEARPEEARRLQAAQERTAARKAAEAASMVETEDDAEVLRGKIDALSEMLAGARHVVVYTGAGISTAANIPDYRGPQGIWTQQKKAPAGKAGSLSSGSRAGGVDKLGVTPTEGHMALAALVRAGATRSPHSVPALLPRRRRPAQQLRRTWRPTLPHAPLFKLPFHDRAIRPRRRCRLSKHRRPAHALGGAAVV